MLERLTNLRALRAAERWPAERLQALQSAKLQRLLDHVAERVPFYRARHAAVAHGAAPERLGRLPVIDKAQLRAAGSNAWDGPERAEDRWICTSGSTGEPYRFPITREYDLLRKAQYLRPYLANGRTLRDRVLRFNATPRQAPWFSRFGLLREEQIRCDAGPATMCERLLATRPQVLQGYPSTLRLLAHHARATGTALPPLRHVFTDSELLSPETRTLIESVTGVGVRDVYGTFETDNIGYQCSAGEAYHLTSDTVVLELLRDGEPVPPGDEGEVVVTVLDNLRSPFVRYNLRDLARLEPGPCRCGSAFPRFRITGGRADDLLQGSDGSLRSAMSALGILDTFSAELVHLQLLQKKDGTCELQYVAAPMPRHDLAERLRSSLSPHLGGQPLRLQRVDAIPLTRAGKLRAFVRETARGA